MSVSRIITIYIGAVVPVFIAGAALHFTKDVLLSTIIDLILSFMIVPMIISNSSNDYQKLENDFDEQKNLNCSNHNCWLWTLLTTALFGGLTFFFFKKGHFYVGYWVMLAPSFDNDMIKIVYFIIAGFLFVIVLPIFEERFYRKFISRGVDHSFIHAIFLNLIQASRAYYVMTLTFPGARDFTLVIVAIWYLFCLFNDWIYKKASYGICVFLHELIHFMIVLLALGIYHNLLGYLKYPKAISISHKENIFSAYV